MLTAINEISSQQAQLIEDRKISMLMEYAHIYSNVIIRYKARDIQLYVDSDAAYLVLPKERIRGSGKFYLSDKLTSMGEIPQSKTNGPILTD